jgi:carbon dioxide concentrating mechanism protein CcmN
MQLSPVQPVSTSHYCVIGDVSIHPHAKIAAGVILQAAPHSQIVIAAGVCVGMGVIIQAYQGIITIDVGASLGAGVLILGTAKIGANACIGATTTIFNTDIATLQVVPAGSLMGDHSRALSATASAPISPNSLNSDQNNQQRESEKYPLSSPPTPETDPPPKSIVIGRAYVNQMLHVLFARNSSPQ